MKNTLAAIAPFAVTAVAFFGIAVFGSTMARYAPAPAVKAPEAPAQLNPTQEYRLSLAERFIKRMDGAFASAIGACHYKTYVSEELCRSAAIDNNEQIKGNIREVAIHGDAAQWLTLINKVDKLERNWSAYWRDDYWKK